MKKRLYILSILLLPITSLMLHVQAQDFLDNLRKDEQGKGKITVNQSQEIEKLVRQNPVESTPQTQQGQKQTQPQQKQQVEQPTTKKQEATHHPTGVTIQQEKEKTRAQSQEKAKPQDNAKETEPAIDTSNKIMRGSYKTKGYRVQVYVGAGPDKRTEESECMRIQQKMKQLFPDLPIYSHFYSPHWKCRIGNFTSLNEAKAVLQKVRRAGYRKACIVQGTISVSR